MVKKKTDNASKWISGIFIYIIAGIIFVFGLTALVLSGLENAGMAGFFYAPVFAILWLIIGVIVFLNVVLRKRKKKAFIAFITAGDPDIKTTEKLVCAFEGAGVVSGMRATKGAIEEIWINGESYIPSYRVIGEVKPRGICGSGLISLLAEMFITGLVDKGGHLNKNLGIDRIREGNHGLEYVIAWGDETSDGKDITITAVDIDNLLRAKGAIYAGYQVLATSVGVPLEMTEKMLIGGSFGKYINVEKAVQIGLLPDMSWDDFHFLGNTSVMGAYHALLDQKANERISEIASKMTYIELSSDNTFYEAFMSALFLPHTDLKQFPSVEAALNESSLNTQK